MLRPFLILLLLLTPLCGCQDAAKPGSVLTHQQVKQQWREIREDSLANLPPPPTIPGNQTRGTLLVREVELPLGPGAAPLFDRAQDDAISPMTRHLWRLNGVRLALVPMSAVQAAASGVMGDQELAARTARVVATDLPTPIRRSPELGGRVELDLMSPPRARRLTTITGGSLQLLVRLPTADPRVIELAPQHHLATASIIPRAPWEKELEGDTYEELAFRIALPAGQALVMALDHDWSGVPQSDAEQGTGEPEDATPTPPANRLTPATLQDPPPQPSPAPSSAWNARDLYRDLPPHAGHALLVADHLGEPVQVVLIITAE